MNIENQVMEQLRESYLKNVYKNSRTMTVEDGIIEANNDGLFQGFIYCGRERHPVKGVLGEELGIHHFEDHCRVAIDRAFRKMSPEHAMSAIGAIWASSDSISRLAEARSRFLVERVDIPESQAPLEIDDKQIEGMEPSLRKSLQKLAACLDGDSIPSPEVELGVDGAILLKWLLPTKKVQVEIESSNIPWPCLKSRFLTVRRNSMTTRVFFNVFDLREHLTSELTEE